MDANADAEACTGTDFSNYDANVPSGVKFTIVVHFIIQPTWCELSGDQLSGGRVDEELS